MMDCITADKLRHDSLKRDHLVVPALFPAYCRKDFTQQSNHVRFTRSWPAVQQTAERLAPSIDVTSASFHFLDNTLCHRGDSVKLTSVGNGSARFVFSAL